MTNSKNCTNSSGGNVSYVLFELFVEINSLFSYCIKFLIDIVKQPSGCFTSFGGKIWSEMNLVAISCIRCVGHSDLIKFGKSNQGKQRYKCWKCNKTRVKNYTYSAYNNNINRQIILLTKEGLGIKNTARVLKISTTTLLKRILLIAREIKQPAMNFGKIYEVDEMRTFVKRKDKLIWIVYALERATKKVVSFNVGRRTNNTLSKVIDSVVLSSPLVIYTDKLKHYKYLIDQTIHKTNRFGTNHIERKNLTLRTHLKRLNRRTICHSKSIMILSAILSIYFWG